MTEKTLTTENIRPALDALRGELAPWPVVAKKQDRLNTAQLNAANSGITSSLVAQIIANTAAIRALESAITGTGLRALVVSSLPAIGTQGILYIVPVTTYDPDTDADVVNYSNEYIWIPVEAGTASEGHYEQVGQTGIVINNGQLNITVNGTSVGTFTANQSGDTTAAITVPTNADYVDLTTNQTIAGTKTFSSTIDGTASKAIADEDGTSIKTGYVNVAGNQTVTGQKTWTGSNTFTSTITTKTNVDRAVAPTSDTTYGTIICRDKNGSAMFRMQGTIKTDLSNAWDMMMVAPNNSYITFFRYTISTATSDRELRFKADSVIPDDNSTSKLGTSTNQWSSVYAQTYFYNGTAWGLDKVNEWSTTNRFLHSLTLKNTNLEKGVVPSSGFSSRTFYFTDKNNADLATIIARTNSSGSSYLSLVAGNLYKNGVIDSTGSAVSAGFYVGTTAEGKPFCDSNADLFPEHNNTFNLGTSTNQWKSVYSQTYYYNGTAWGLDKDNTWTGVNTFSKDNLYIQTGYTLGTAPQSEDAQALLTGRTADSNFVTGMYFYQSPTKGTGLRLTVRNKWDANGYSTTGTTRNAHFEFLQGTDKTAYFQWQGYVNNGLYPLANNTYDLGDSSTKWKTLNGVNPGALSLPDYDSNAKIDISGLITPDQYNNIYYTPPVNGWLYVCFNISSATTSDPIFYIQAKDNNVANSSFVQTSWMLASVNPVNLAIFFPVVANKRFIMQINFSNYTIIKAHIIPCLGNV